MKNTILILVLGVFIVSCKSNSSAIVTSKKEAIKRNLYSYNLQSNTEAKKNAEYKIIKYTPDNAFQDEVPQPILLNKNADDVVIVTENPKGFNNQIIDSALQNLGSPYHTGGTSKSGFDCSGLVYSTFKNFNIILPRTSTDMSRIGRVLNREEIRKGDLIFFRTNGRTHINHVGIVIETTDEEIKFVHSSTQRGVIVSTTKEDYYHKTFAQVNRVIE